MATAPQTLPGHRERFLHCGWIFYFMTTEAEGRKGRHSAQNGMLAVEQASSVRWASAKRSGGTGRSQDRQQSLLCPSQALTSFCIYLQKAGYRLAGQEAEMSYDVLRKQSSANNIQTPCFTSCLGPPDLQHRASFPDPARQNSTQPSPGKPD